MYFVQESTKYLLNSINDDLIYVSMKIVMLFLYRNQCYPVGNGGRVSRAAVLPE